MIKNASSHIQEKHRKRKYQELIVTEIMIPCFVTRLSEVRTQTLVLGCQSPSITEKNSMKPIFCYSSSTSFAQHSSQPVIQKQKWNRDTLQATSIKEIQ